MKRQSMVLAAIATLGLAVAIPMTLAHRSMTAPSASMKQHGEGMHHGGMMHEMRVSSEFEYLSQMIPHHQEAIDTAKIVLARSDRPEMKAFAMDIIRVQTVEIEQMRQWLSEWYPEQDMTADYTPMMRDLENLQGNALDQAFLEDMVMHHMGAIMMSRMLLNQNLVEHEPVRPFAQQIASTQGEEIQQMQAWLKEWFGVAGSMPGMQH
ncbi:MAG: DUF305 domain-containing protein [Oculatellaceae cyanobacterium Prado106]|jgi:uncharacterized protein (DUF305 family)|nr:DUF305 domain-containing protein [Oculatellaceae cyanobacterium Prado106]